MLGCTAAPDRGRRGDFMGIQLTARRRVVAGLAALAVAAAAVGLVGAAPTAHAAAAAVPLPPFTQCPAVGASPSCQVLLVVNPDGTVSVYSDPDVGDYDGGDDTLVGIRNMSGKAVDAVTVTGPGSDLAGFDGDGLCTYGIAGCPFGPTGYEGPGTSFVTNTPTGPDTAEVDFTGGLADGASTYFALEGTLTSAVLTARQGHLDQRYRRPLAGYWHWQHLHADRGRRRGGGLHRDGDVRWRAARDRCAACGADPHLRRTG